MFGPQAVRPGERAGCVCLVGLKRGWPRIMRSSEWAGEAKGIAAWQSPAAYVKLPP